MRSIRRSRRAGRSKFPCSSTLAIPKTASNAITPAGGAPSKRIAASLTGSPSRSSPGWKRSAVETWYAAVRVMHGVEAPEPADRVVRAVPKVGDDVEADDRRQDGGRNGQQHGVEHSDVPLGGPVGHRPSAGAADHGHQDRVHEPEPQIRAPSRPHVRMPALSLEPEAQRERAQGHDSAQQLHVGFAERHDPVRGSSPVLPPARGSSSPTTVQGARESK